MELKNYLAGLVIGTSTLFGGTYTPNTNIGSVVQAEDEKTGELTLEEIATEMSKPDCNAILKTQKNIEFVTYDSKLNKTNFNELVYQKHLPLSERKPVVVLWYANKINGKKHPTLMRSSIIFKQWAEEFEGQLKFVAYEANIDTSLASKNYSGLLNNYSVRAIPSFSLYHTDDYSTSKKEQKIHLIDVWRGGPSKNKFVKSWVADGIGYWIASNITRKNNKSVWRIQNSSPNTWTEIKYDK